MQVKLVSQEGKTFEVEKRVAEMSELVKSMISEDSDSESDQDEIPLPNVTSQTLTKVLEFCEHHCAEPLCEIEKPLTSASMSDVVQAWYAKFVDVERDALFELIAAANYLDIKPLFNLTTATLALLMRGKDVEGLRATFGIENDFTPEEEAMVREENKWCEEA